MLIYSSKWWVVLLQWWISLDNHIQLLELPIHTHPPQRSFSRKKVSQEDCDNATSTRAKEESTKPTSGPKPQLLNLQVRTLNTQHIQDTCHHVGCKSSLKRLCFRWFYQFFWLICFHLSLSEGTAERQMPKQWKRDSIDFQPGELETSPFLQAERSNQKQNHDIKLIPSCPTIDHKEDASFSSCHKYSSSTSNNWSCRQVNRIALIFFTSPSGAVPSNCGSFHAYTDISF